MNAPSELRSKSLKLIVLSALLAVTACAKKSSQRGQVVECSSISLDAKGTTQCLVQLYHWKPVDSQKAATDRAHELESLKTHQEDSVWALGAAKHKRDLGSCSRTDDQLKNCLLVAGWPLQRVNAAQDSLWKAELPKHRRELETCAAKREMNLSSCLTLYYKWDSDRALATADSLARERLGGAPQRRR
jgi:hypothetical protein